MAEKNTRDGISLKRMVPIAVIAVIAVLGFATLGDYLSFESLRDNRLLLVETRDNNYLLASIAFIAVYVAVVAFSLPGATAATLTGGFLFGLFPGALYNVLSATIGASAIFLAARMGLGEYLSRKMDESSGTVSKMRDELRQNEVSVLFLLRLVPAVPFFAANLVPALAGASFRNFVFTTFFGIIPGTIIYTWVGVGLGAVFERGETPNLGIIFEWHILGPILGLCALAALPILIRVVRRRGGAGNGN
ncbi:MAG: TVP38/TMEM64 family protein [Rhodobacteraceae bacterium]|nr:TVP38/TMEM64 family protein [Paracoccaceae bacterium]